jgi:hypothetical protein
MNSYFIIFKIHLLKKINNKVDKKNFITQKVTNFDFIFKLFNVCKMKN